MTPWLHSERLAMRPLSADDEAFYCSLYGDPQLMSQIGPPLSAAAAVRSFRVACRQLQRQQRLVWVMQEIGAGHDIGLLALIPDAGTREGEIGAILLVQHQNQGYAAEAIRALITHAFKNLVLSAVHTRHDATNALAAGLMRKLGFTRIDNEPGTDCRWRLRP